MKELLKQLIDKGFESKTTDNSETIICILNQNGNFDLSDISILLLLEEIKAWFRNEYDIYILPLNKNKEEWNVIFEKENIQGASFNEYPYKSYELALKAGIEKAVKLI